MRFEREAKELLSRHEKRLPVRAEATSLEPADSTELDAETTASRQQAEELRNQVETTLDQLLLWQENVDAAVEEILRRQAGAIFDAPTERFTRNKRGVPAKDAQFFAGLDRVGLLGAQTRRWTQLPGITTLRERANDFFSTLLAEPVTMATVHQLEERLNEELARIAALQELFEERVQRLAAGGHPDAMFISPDLWDTYFVRL